MAIIKSAQFEQMSRSAVVLDLGDLRRQAERIEHAALEKARTIVSEAKQERERILRGAAEEGAASGHAEGLAKGLQEGAAKGREEALALAGAELASLTQSWGDALARFEEERDEMLLSARAELMGFAASVAEKVTRRVVEQNPDIVNDVLASALGLIIRPTRLTIECCADDRERVDAAAPALLARIASSAHCEVATAPNLSRGSIIVRTQEGEVDATIEVQLARILDAALPDRTSRPINRPETEPERQEPGDAGAQRESGGS